MKGIKYEDVEKALKYIHSQECRAETKKNAIVEIVEWLNLKYPASSVTMDFEKETVKIEGDNIGEILNDLKEIGL